MLNPSIAELVAAGALFVVNHSGGKDSQFLYKTVKAQVPAGQIVIIHADLGRVEWPGLKALIREKTDDAPMYVTRNLNKDLLSMADERGMFPSPKYRQCTSDLKRAPIERQIRQLTPKKADGSLWLVVDCIGQRAQESKDRSKLKPFERHAKNCNGVREWFIWRPIHGASIDEVWASEGHTAEELEQRRALWKAGRKDEAVAGWGFHWAYVAGMSRLSCSFCIMSTKADIQVAGRERPDLLAEYDAIERKHDVTMMMPQGGKRLFLTDIVAMADAELVAEGCGACGGGCTSEPEIEAEATEADVDALIAAGALFVVNHSGGKDSQAMAVKIVERVPVRQLLFVHAPVREEWPGALELAQGQAEKAGIAFVLAPSVKSFLELVEYRFEKYPEAPSFPQPGNRQCTSDLKRGPIEREVRRYAGANGFKVIVTCMGLRSQESRDRAKMKTWRKNVRQSIAGRTWFEWLPIHHLSTAEVFGIIAADGQEPHFAYGLGNERLSCIFCLMGSANDLKNGAIHNPRLYRQYVATEQKTGYTLHASRKTLPEITGLAVDENFKLTVLNAPAKIKGQGCTLKSA